MVFLTILLQDAILQADVQSASTLSETPLDLSSHCSQTASEQIPKDGRNFPLLHIAMTALHHFCRFVSCSFKPPISVLPHHRSPAGFTSGDTGWHPPSSPTNCFIAHTITPPPLVWTVNWRCVGSICSVCFLQMMWFSGAHWCGLQLSVRNDENQLLLVRGHGSLPENAGLLSPGLGESCCPKWRSECTLAGEMDGWVDAPPEATWWLYQSIKFYLYSPYSQSTICLIGL